MKHFFIIVFTVLFIPLTVQAAELGTQPNIQVAADGVISVQPDYAVVRMNVTGKNKSATKAVEYSGDAMGQILGVLEKDFDVEDKDVQTSMIRVNPVYVSCRDTTRLKQLGIAPEFCEGSIVDYYNTSRGLTLNYRDIENFPELLSKLLNVTLSNEVQLSVYNVQLKTSKEEELKSEARLLAAKNARTKAQSVAKALDADIGQPIQINVDRVRVPVVNIPLADNNRGGGPQAMMMRAAPTAEFRGGNNNSVAVGEIDIKASISAVFALK